MDKYPQFHERFLVIHPYHFLAEEPDTKIKDKLGDKHNEASNIIEFLNSKNKYELEDIEIDDKTETIL